jgi:hypothetical protein
MPINSNIQRVDVVKRDKDVVGRIKMSMSENIYDADFEYGKQPLRWEEFTAGGGTITHLPGVGACAMFLPANAPSAITIRQSRPYHRYQPGKSLFMATALQLGAANTNQIQRFGFFDDANGMFFEQSQTNAGNPSGMYCVIRSDTNYFPTATAPAYIVTTTATAGTGSTVLNVATATGIFPGQRVTGPFGGIAANTFVTAVSGTFVSISTPTSGTLSSTQVQFQYLSIDVRFDYANWSDPQGIKSQIDWTKIQMFWMEYAWYGAGALRWGVLINGEPFVLHEVGSGNNGTYGGGVLPGTGNGVVAWSRTGNLPVRYEQRDNGSAVANTMYHYGVSVMMEGKKDEQRGFTYSYGMNPAVPRRYISPNSTRFPVLSIQPRVMGIQEVGNVGSLGETTIGISSATVTSASFSGTVTLPRIQSFIVSGSTTTIQFRRAHGLPTGTSPITLSGFLPSGINASYTATYTSPSTVTITNGTAASTIGTATLSGANFGTNQFAGRSFYYQGTNGLFQMARITTSNSTAVAFVEPIQGGTMAVAPLTSTGSASAAFIAGSTTMSYSGLTGSFFVGMTVTAAIGGILAAGTTIVSITGTSSGTLVLSNAPTASGGSVAITFTPTYYIGQINRGQLLPLQLMVSSDSLCVVELIASTPGNPVVLTNPAFQQLATLGSPNSFATRDVSATAVSGGEVVSAFTSPAGGSGIIPIDLENFFPLYNTILGGLPDILTVAITTKATQTSSPPISSLIVSGGTATLSFIERHGLNPGDSVTLAGFTPSGLNATYTVLTTPSLTDITFTSASSSPTVIGTAVLSNGANVGAHLICQEAMS